MMLTSTARSLLRVNRTFYNTFAADFSASRSHLQPGIMRVMAELQPYSHLLDVGCGNGRLLAASQEHAPDSHYVGVDFSHQLLHHTPTSPRCDFIWADLAYPGWATGLQGSFDAAVCFSVLHHIPGRRRRLRLLREINSAMQPGARCALSVWQFLHLPRLRRKIVPWEQIGLTQKGVDSGDYLMDWNRGGHGLRYVHQFESADLNALCARAGFKVEKIFRSDGEGGALGLYVLMRSSR